MDKRSDILAEMITPARRERMESVLAARVRSVAVVLENLYDPHNISAVLRTCEATGIQDVHIVETEHKFKFSSGITRGCEKWLTIYRHPNPEACAAELRGAGYEISVADHRPATPRIEDLPPVKRRVYWMGAEHRGLSQEARALADSAYRIPMQGFTESFNVSVAAALTLYTARRTWETQTGLTGDLSPGETEELRLSWLKKQIRRSDEILDRFDVGDDRKSWRTPKTLSPSDTQ